MPTAKDIQGSVFERSSAQMLARVVNVTGLPIQIADISTIQYSVYEADPCRLDEWTVVTGHDSVPLSPIAVVFDTLQLSEPWDVDEVGYNFRHDLSVSSSEAFPEAGRTYQIRYEFLPVVGEIIVVRFQVQAI